VGIDSERLRALTLSLLETPPDAADDPAHHRRRTDAETLAYVLTLDAINFGSGWFPSLRKRPGCSGYFTVALALADRFDAAGAWSAAELRGIDREELAEVLGQDPSAPEVAALLELYARALRELGTFLEERYGGRFAGPVEAAAGSAARLVETLVAMPLYRDVALYGELEVPFLKRAQITVADLRLAFAGSGPGRFDDVDELTLFADNLVPHVLRLEGVLRYEAGLLARIEAGRLLAPGSPEEVEIRACALHAVELMAAVTREHSRPVPPWRLDEWLWTLGQHPDRKASPRHRCRCSYY
jgi:hypothetical protein